MSNSGVLDTRFRSALERMAVQGRLNAYTAPIDPHLEIAAVMKKLDGGPALLFSAVDGYDIPVVGNLLSWSEDGTAYSAVSDLAATDLETFAKAFRAASAER